MKQVPARTLRRVEKLLLAGKRSPEIRAATGVSRWTVTLTAGKLGVVIPSGRPRKTSSVLEVGR